MYSNNKLIRDVADVAAQIMSGQPVTEKLHPNQQKLDVHEPEKDELTADDFKKLRAGKKPDVKKEEVEQIDELKKSTLGSYIKKAANSAASMRKIGSDFENMADKSRKPSSKQAATTLADKYKSQSRARRVNIGKAVDRLTKEEEQIDEVKMADLPSTKVQGRAYGASKPEPHAVDVMKGPKDTELKDIEAEKKKKKFSEMIDLYNEKGLKSLSEMLVKEEPDNEQFTKELEDAKAKSEGKKKNDEIAKGAVQAIKSEEVEQIEEREMTDAEMKKREKIVKSMKKGMAGFKERYGDRAKNVMYATANKQAMKD